MYENKLDPGFDMQLKSETAVIQLNVVQVLQFLYNYNIISRMKVF